MRYAIYYTPSLQHPLAHAAMTWLGRNGFDDKVVPTYHGFEDLVAAPRKYGFHGTLKAPFRLAEGHNEAELLAQFQDFAARQKSFTLPALTLARLGPFFALVPSASNQDLQKLCDDCVTHFEPFRAPLSEADIARRKPETLTSKQCAHLMAWGYPYVFDEFRFHLTLTGQVPQTRASNVEAALHAHFAEFIDQSLAIDMLALFVEPEAGAPFKVHATAGLGKAN